MNNNKLTLEMGLANYFARVLKNFQNNVFVFHVFVNEEIQPNPLGRLIHYRKFRADGLTLAPSEPTTVTTVPQWYRPNIASNNGTTVAASACCRSRRSQ